MPSPSGALATLRPDIAGSLTEFDLVQNQANFIWNQILPVFEVQKQAGTFGRIPVEQLLQQRSVTRGNKGGYSRGQWEFDDESYACKEYGAEEPIDDREAAMYSDYFDAETIAAQRAMDAVLRGAEERVAAAIFNTTTWTGSALTTAVGTAWSTAASATPITDVEAAVRKVWDGCGMWPNALIMSRHVFRNLRLCTQVKDAITASGAGDAAKQSDITAAMLAQVFDLPYIIVAGGAKNSAKEGQSATFANIWSNSYAMVARIAETNDIREPCLGRTFHWGEDGSSVMGTVETYRDETVRADIVRVRHDVAEKILYTEAGHLLSNIT